MFIFSHSRLSDGTVDDTHNIRTYTLKPPLKLTVSVLVITEQLYNIPVHYNRVTSYIVRKNFFVVL